MLCYATEFPARETDIRREYAVVASEWRRISRKVSLDKEEVNPDDLFEKTDDLIESTRSQMSKIWAADKAPDECKESTKIRTASGPTSELLELAPHLPSLFSNGYVI
jgi:hypothetical protein